MSDDPICEACGHPRSNHPYRHPFVGPSRDDTIKQQADRIEELEAKLAKAEWLLVDASVQLEEGKIKTRRNRAVLIRQFLAELTGGKDE